VATGGSSRSTRRGRITKVIPAGHKRTVEETWRSTGSSRRQYPIQGQAVQSRRGMIPRHCLTINAFTSASFPRHPCVIPATPLRHSRESGNPGRVAYDASARDWIPAFAGMTQGDPLGTSYPATGFPKAGYRCPGAEHGIPNGRCGDPDPRLDVPSPRLDTPSLRLDVPSPRLDAPSLRLDVLSLRLDVLSLRLDVPSLRLNAPSLRLDVPSLRLDALSLRLGDL